MSTGSTIKVNFRVESREYNGRWYTDVRAFGLTSMSAPASQPMSSQGESYGEPVLNNTMDGITQSDPGDLPF